MPATDMISATATTPSQDRNKRKSSKRAVNVAVAAPAAQLDRRAAARRFLVVTNGFKAHAVLSSPVLPIHSIQEVLRGTATQPLVIGNVHALTELQNAERSDLVVSVKLFLPNRDSASRGLSDSILEAIESTRSLLKTTHIDSLVVQLPVEVASTPRKSRRLDPTWDSIMHAANAEFDVQAVGVSSRSSSSAAEFVRGLTDEQLKQIRNVTVDYPRGLNPVCAAKDDLGMVALLAAAAESGFSVGVSNDGEDGLPECSFVNIVDQLNAKSDSADSVDSIVQDWVAKYTCFDTSRSVLLQHGYIVMGSTQ